MEWRYRAPVGANQMIFSFPAVWQTVRPDKVKSLAPGHWEPTCPREEEEKQGKKSQRSGEGWGGPPCIGRRTIS